MLKIKEVSDMREYHLCTGIKGKPNYEIADIIAHSIEEAMVKATAYLGWNFSQITIRF